MERQAEHREAPQQLTVAGRQRVDPDRGGRLDRFGERTATGGRRDQQVEQELRVPVRPLHHQILEVRRERRVLRRCLGKRHHVAALERAQRQALRSAGGSDRHLRLTGPSEDEEQPRPVGSPPTRRSHRADPPMLRRAGERPRTRTRSPVRIVARRKPRTASCSFVRTNSGARALTSGDGFHLCVGRHGDRAGARATASDPCPRRARVAVPPRRPTRPPSARRSPRGGCRATRCTASVCV